VRILARDVGDSPQQQGETDGEDALFPAGKDAAAEVERTQGGLFGGSSTEIVGDEAYFFVFLGSGGDGFAELAEAKHGRPQYRME
jgi:hypothetical protein